MDMRVMPRVLVAHAEKGMRELLKLYLVCAGYEVAVAQDAVEAGREVLRQPPDAIVLDVDMPYMDGVDFVSALQSDGASALIPVVFLTTNEKAADRAVRLGATACLTTPLLADEFLEAVAHCLQPRSVAGFSAGIRAPRVARAA
jgi:CheY-like chemotaxis protein